MAYFKILGLSMRIFLHVSVIFITIFIFLGCAHTNAFSRFDFDEIKERATSSLRTSKIAKENEIIGVVSSSYLNEVNPKKYNGMEYFYITVYTKNRDKLYDPNILQEQNMTLKLNNQLPVKIKELGQDNIFAGLLPLNNSWNSYYLVAFNKVNAEVISLVLENGRFVSQPLIYRKGEQ